MKVVWKYDESWGEHSLEKMYDIDKYLFGFDSGDYIRKKRNKFAQLLHETVYNNLYNSKHILFV